MQDREQRDRHRLREVQHLGGPGKDGVGVAQVGVYVLGGARLMAVWQRAGVSEQTGS